MSKGLHGFVHAILARFRAGRAACAERQRRDLMADDAKRTAKLLRLAAEVKASRLAREARHRDPGNPF